MQLSSMWRIHAAGTENPSLDHKPAGSLNASKNLLPAIHELRDC